MLERPEPERAALIGRLYAHERGRALAEVLADVETDPEGLAGLRLPSSERAGQGHDEDQHEGAHGHPDLEPPEYDRG